MHLKWTYTSMTNDRLNQFREMCQNHDITYTYSDDGSVYRRGETQYKEIVEFSKSLSHEDAVKIWNEVVDKKFLHERDRADYRWK